MNLDTVKSSLREVWYLVVLFAAALVVAAYMFTTQRSATNGEGLAVSSAATATQIQDERLTIPEPQASRPTEQDRARAAIAEYQKKIDEDPKNPDTPALLNAMANVSRQKLGDYKSAAEYYELLIADHPDWGGIAKVYPQLATCYERLGDMQSMQDVYKRMMRKFPSESQEYLYAKNELGM
jgi:tetratricopeptide (TPR) repeat protein